MSERILAAIRSQPWAIMPGYLEAIEALAMRALEHPAVADVAVDGHVERHLEAIAVMGERIAGTKAATIRDGVASLPLFGPILPRAAMISPSGGGAIALDHVAADLRALQANPQVRTVLMVWDSPGGNVTQVREFAQLVAGFQKPIVSHVTGMCCSAAYHIGSQTTEITADPFAIVGSIGVMMGGSVQESADMQGRREVAVVSSNAPNKRPDLSSDEGQAQIRALLDELEAIMIADIARGRGVSPDTVKTAFGAGGTKTGEQAKAAGMVDRVEAGGLEATLTRLASPARSATPRRTAAANTLRLTRARAGLNPQGD